MRLRNRTIFSFLFISFVLIAMLLNFYGGYPSSRDSESSSEMTPGTDEPTSTRVTTGEDSKPAQLLDRAVIHPNGKYTSDFWVPDEDINFGESTEFNAGIKVKIFTNGNLIQDVVISTFKMDSSFQPVDERTINCGKSDASGEQKCFFKDDAHGEYSLTYKGDESTLATVQFSEVVRSEEAVGLIRSTWLL